MKRAVLLLLLLGLACAAPSTKITQPEVPPVLPARLVIWVDQEALPATPEFEASLAQSFERVGFEVKDATTFREQSMKLAGCCAEPNEYEQRYGALGVDWVIFFTIDSETKHSLTVSVIGVLEARTLWLREYPFPGPTRPAHFIEGAAEETARELAAKPPAVRQ